MRSLLLLEAGDAGWHEAQAQRLLRHESCAHTRWTNRRRLVNARGRANERVPETRPRRRSEEASPPTRLPRLRRPPLRRRTVLPRPLRHLPTQTSGGATRPNRRPRDRERETRRDARARRPTVPGGRTAAEATWRQPHPLTPAGNERQRLGRLHPGAVPVGREPVRQDEDANRDDAAWSSRRDDTANFGRGGLGWPSYADAAM
jgi:hypothetical protein